MISQPVGFSAVALANPNDWLYIGTCLAQLRHKGWTRDEAVLWCMCLPEVSPGLPESVATRRRAVIEAHVAKRLATRKVQWVSVTL